MGMVQAWSGVILMTFYRKKILQRFLKHNAPSFLTLFVVGISNKIDFGAIFNSTIKYVA